MGPGDFLAIEPIGGDRRFSFEELCCQLAFDEPRTADARYFRKGRGADADSPFALSASQHALRKRGLVSS